VRSPRLHLAKQFARPDLGAQPDLRRVGTTLAQRGWFSGPPMAGPFAGTCTAPPPPRTIKGGVVRRRQEAGRNEAGRAVAEIRPKSTSGSWEFFLIARVRVQRHWGMGAKKGCSQIESYNRKTSSGSEQRAFPRASAITSAVTSAARGSCPHQRALQDCRSPC
jgi:hypothetical protein